MNTMQDSARLVWSKSSYSGDEGGECVEVASGAVAVHVRDSKERGGPRLVFAPDVWSGFVAGLGRDAT
ncbi:MULTISPECIES: DUF397 domain-containing protein [Streptomyces]|uniref:DUF397 domain-containing protein n=1 Tax=Streptomyces fradiae ATCC 10745 = DSM 40063 TaxID=1319510 RepID=A0A1Y2NP77_STRFR|nr:MULTISPECIES: DUF397 domain-containing protein [Streptomyces]KAF0650799.1 hypothetical protein K701_05325 [Streptomyces fradiae ATCC 10745 = DSM 40063]OSY48847.1 hypothetical protein BG846_05577 [Streptomyces fradiae ATCC 10745 = DSM 40063]QEV15120.1 DUF397 domain-containing protein [Streptomyces fradiae ATCC 10745 = DSM 40063]